MSGELPVASIAGVCEVQREGPAGRPVDYLIELPHGATRREQFDTLVARMAGRLPDDLVAFFLVNTDIGTPECAAEIARRLAQRGAATLVLRCLIPRTLVDCNRVIVEGSTGGGMTPAIPEYVRDERDGRELRRLHATWCDAARRAYAAVCGAGGLALTLHTYAPRSVGIERLDDEIVRALRAAYEPEVYERWPRRPDVDAICEDLEGRHLAPPGFVEALEREYATIGIEVARSATYRLHPESLGHVHSIAHPGRVACVEISRGLLTEAFVPFVELRIDPRKVARMAAPIVEALGRAAR